jgi:hypothetical protein
LFSGCNAAFILKDDESSGIIVAEGKKQQLEKFMGWMGVLSSDLVNRKPNFQGPSLIIKVLSQKWEPFSGELDKGFITSHEAPVITDAKPADGKLEAKSMAGTDESV